MMNKNQIAKLGGQLQKSSLHHAAQKLGSRGGAIGGPARARALSPARRKEIARIAGSARKRKRDNSTT